MYILPHPSPHASIRQSLSRIFNLPTSGEVWVPPYDSPSSGKNQKLYESLRPGVVYSTSEHFSTFFRTTHSLAWLLRSSRWLQHRYSLPPSSAVVQRSRLILQPTRKVTTNSSANTSIPSDPSISDSYHKNHLSHWHRHHYRLLDYCLSSSIVYPAAIHSSSLLAILS